MEGNASKACKLIVNCNPLDMHQYKLMKANKYCVKKVPVHVLDRSICEKKWMLQAFCVNAELRIDLGQFEGADFKKLVCQAWFETFTLKFA